ncbi:DUF4336 domain-containing protein [Corallococcus exercitus]|uniref:DUF4336 domain-containing protein n=1 Tax=Corallococcus exercitus TaxID=2316736 RepID=A0A7Y4JV13_9BACT|nr:DUF4336 domain-containing protein [Corallococcus exercitus]NOK11686.1 DUF4336 domain-containing protein [Corallococcus exercitus]
MPTPPDAAPHGLADDVFVFEAPFSLFGVPVGGRMTVLRLPDGGLWVHSPVAFTPERRAAVEALGPVRFLVAPNLFHHLHLPDWAAAFPDARVVVPAGLRAKQPALRIDQELEDTPDPAWAPVLDQMHVRGMPQLNEFLFFHRPSRTLLVTDLAFHYPRAEGWKLRAYLWLDGVLGRFAAPRFLRLFTKDREAARAALQRALKWDVERVVVCHGQVLEHGGQKALHDAFTWL